MLTPGIVAKHHQTSHLALTVTFKFKLNMPSALILISDGTEEMGLCVSALFCVHLRRNVPYTLLSEAPLPMTHLSEPAYHALLLLFQSHPQRSRPLPTTFLLQNARGALRSYLTLYFLQKTVVLSVNSLPQFSSIDLAVVSPLKSSMHWLFQAAQKVPRLCLSLLQFRILCEIMSRKIKSLV